MGLTQPFPGKTRGLYLLKRWYLRSIAVLTCFGASNISVLDPAIVTGMEVYQSQKSHLFGGSTPQILCFLDTEKMVIFKN